jgi:hypothetical protein
LSFIRFLLAIALSVLQFTAFDCPVGVFKLLLIVVFHPLLMIQQHELHGKPGGNSDAPEG